MKKSIYVTKDQLTQINDESIRHGFNRTLDRDFVARLPDDLRFPVETIKVGERGAYVRCSIFIATKTDASDGGLYFLDMTNGAFDSLPFVEPKKHEGVEVSPELLRFIKNTKAKSKLKRLPTFGTYSNAATASEMSRVIVCGTRLMSFAANSVRSVRGRFAASRTTVPRTPVIAKGQANDRREMYLERPGSARNFEPRTI